MALHYYLSYHLKAMLRQAYGCFRPGYTPARYQRMLREPTPQARFARIYREGLWLNSLNPAESRSGSGSTVSSTEVFRVGLEQFLATYPGRVLFDAPCGDFNYMQHVKLPKGWSYIGGDIVPELVESNREKYPGNRFIPFDITQDTFPDCDLWLCRDCLFHLSFEDIKKALLNFTRSSAKHALITSHLNVAGNADVITGDFRQLDLALPPFSLPKPQHAIDDLPVDGERRIVGVWSKEEIAEAIRKMI
jgi:hypothetical protein